jgi:hypothetical protein
VRTDNHSESTLARIVDAAAANSCSLTVHRPPVQFPEESAPAHPLGSMLFPEAAKAWLLTRRDHIAPRTYVDYENHIKVLSRSFRSVALGEITGNMLRDYQRRRRQTVGPGMINKECGIVCMIRDRIGLALTDYQRMPMPKDYESPGRGTNDGRRSQA